MIGRISKKAGMSPGTLIHIGEKRTGPARLTRIVYDRNDIRETAFDYTGEFTDDADGLPASVPEPPPAGSPVDGPENGRGAQPVTWINIDGIHDISLIEAVGKRFDIHPLVLEDIVNTEQRPKVEDHEQYLFITLKHFQIEDDGQSRVEQVSLILGDDYVLSFCETPLTVIESVRKRLRRMKSKIRGNGADYLAYALLDTIVDHYFIFLEYYNEKIEALEEEMFDDPQPETLQAIHTIKREVLFFHRRVWPLRDLLSWLKKEESSCIRETSLVFIEDVHDHVRQVVDAAESLRDILIGLQELYLSTISQKMNEVMKMLTIIATIFIPLTFIVGVYGMNFEYMPELTWPWAYFAVLGAMAVLVGGLLIYFKKRKWL